VGGFRGQNIEKDSANHPEPAERLILTKFSRRKNAFENSSNSTHACRYHPRNLKVSPKTEFFCRMSNSAIRLRTACIF